MLTCPKYCEWHSKQWPHLKVFNLLKNELFILITTRLMIILVNENKGKFKENLEFLNYVSNYWA
jgi:hypothetical protein